MGFWNSLLSLGGDAPHERRDSEVIVNPFAFGDLLIEADSGDVKLSSVLSIPSVWAAVEFLSGTLSALPLRIYNKETSDEVTEGPEYLLLSEEPSTGYTSLDWRKSVWKSVFTYGRSFTYIERNRNGTPRQLHWQFDPSAVVAERFDGELRYKFTSPGTGEVKFWAPGDVIDLAWIRSNDGLDHYSPSSTHKDAFETAFLFSKYQKKFAKSGGVPPFVLRARWNSPTAVKEGLREFLTSVRMANKKGDVAIPIAKDMEIHPLGVSPEQGRIMETQQFIVRQVCRIYNIPPIYLHDIDRMTFNNAEHQALNLIKYTLLPWATQLESQVSLKVLGSGRIARHDMDDLQRGDYRSRIEAHSIAVQSGQLTPNEARDREDLPEEEGGDELFMQSGTMPINQLEQQNEEENNPPDPGIPGVGNPGGA